MNKILTLFILMAVIPILAIDVAGDLEQDKLKPKIEPIENETVLVRIRVEKKISSSWSVVIVDSVMQGDLFNQTHWKLHRWRQCPEIDSGSYWIVAIKKVFNYWGYDYDLYLNPKSCDILPNTPENRKVLKKIWHNSSLGEDLPLNQDKSIAKSAKKNQAPSSPKILFPEFLVAKIQVQREPMRWGDTVLVDSVLRGSRKLMLGYPIDQLNPACPKIKQGSYIALVYKPKIINEWIGLDPVSCDNIVPDTPQNRRRLFKKWDACEQWRQSGDTPPGSGKLCGEK